MFYCIYKYFAEAGLKRTICVCLVRPQQPYETIVSVALTSPLPIKVTGKQHKHLNKCPFLKGSQLLKKLICSLKANPFL